MLPDSKAIFAQANSARWPKPETQAPISVDQEATTASTFRTRTGVSSNGAVSIGSQTSWALSKLMDDIVA